MNPRRIDQEAGQDPPQAANEQTDPEHPDKASDGPEEVSGADAASVLEAGEEGGESAAESVATDDPGTALERMEEELRMAQERLLRMAAEYENFRKRTARERTELWGRAQAEVVSGILDALDDLGRVLDLDTGSVSAADVVSGVELVQRKLVRELERAGLERVGEVGETFDPNHHEAIGSLVAETEEQDHTVGAVFQPGYKFGPALLRPARVQVFMWSGPGGQGAQ